MSRAWQTVDRWASPDGLLELRQRGPDDFLICIDGRVLMNSRASRSEEELGMRACAGLDAGARILVGGLGMGFTLRAILDVVHPETEVIVAELHPVVVEWCRGPLSGLTDACLEDSRVSLRIGDVAESIRDFAQGREPLDAIVLDLFEGPHARTDVESDSFYGRAAIRRSYRALAPRGVFAVWSEGREERFQGRLRSAGFTVESHRPGRGGFRHWVVLGRKPD